MSQPAFAPDCLKGKSILITGGCGAIGRVVVEKLTAHGARVAVNDITPDAPYRADTTNEPEVVALFNRAGPLDVVCCHAGMVETIPIADYPLTNFEKLMDANLKASFLVAREAARRWKGKRSDENPGKIIFTTSWVQDVPWPEITPYNASKSALKMLMRGLARELAADHIRCNALAPGIVAVGLAQRQWDADPAYRARAQKAIPLGYMQPPETVADAFLFLCSDAAHYMTGATLLVDGGCSLYPMD